MELNIRIGYSVTGRELYAIRIEGSPTLSEIQSDADEPIQIGVLGGSGWRPDYEESTLMPYDAGAPEELEENLERAETLSGIHRERYVEGTVYYMSEEDMHDCYYDSEEIETGVNNARYLMMAGEIILPALITQTVESERDIVETLEGTQAVNRTNSNNFTLQVSVSAASELGSSAISICNALIQQGHDAYLQVEPPTPGRDCLLMKRIVVKDLSLQESNVQEGLTTITLEYEYSNASDAPDLNEIASRANGNSASSIAITTARLESLRAQLEALIARYQSLNTDVSELKETLLQLILEGGGGSQAGCEASTAEIAVQSAQTIAAEVFNNE